MYLTFDAEFKSAKIQNSLYGGERVWVQLPTIDAVSISAKHFKKISRGFAVKFQDKTHVVPRSCG